MHRRLFYVCLSIFAVVSNFQIATIEEIDVLVTDESLGKTALEALETHAVRGLVAKASTVII